MKYTIEGAITKLVIEDGRTIRIHRLYLPVALAMAAQGLIQLGAFKDGMTEIGPIEGE